MGPWRGVLTLTLASIAVAEGLALDPRSPLLLALQSELKAKPGPGGTAEVFLTNLVLFGKDPFRLDILGHCLIAADRPDEAIEVLTEAWDTFRSDPDVPPFLPAISANNASRNTIR